MAWIAHLIGTRRAPGCLYGSTAAKSEARQQRQALEEKASKQDTNKSTQKHSRSASDSTSQAESSKLKKLKQTPLKAYRNLDMPFSANDIAAIEAQILHATISANLPFRAFEDPEVLELLCMLRTAAPDIMPSRKVVSGQLLDEAAQKVKAKLEKVLVGKEIGLSYVLSLATQVQSEMDC